MIKEYKRLVKIPITTTIREDSVCEVPLLFRNMTKDEIIIYLESENRKLNKKLSTIKQYLGEDYYDSCIELEEELKNELGK